MPSYGGTTIFGRSPSITMVPNPAAVQYSAFWGVSGVYSQFGGSRGRVFHVHGHFYGVNVADLWNSISLFQSYDDGIARVLVDTVGNSWPQVVYKHCELAGKYGYGHGGVLMEYKAIFEGRL